MAVHWTISFKSFTGADRVISIYDSSFSGTAVALTGAADPFTIQEEDDEDVYLPIRTQTGYIKFIAESASILQQMLPESVTDRPVVLTEGNTILWVGFLTGEEYDQPWDTTPYEVEVPVVSVMDAMKGVWFTQSKGWNSIYTLLQTINSYCPVAMEATASTDTPITDVFVENSNWQTYLTPAERVEHGTNNVYETESLYHCMEEWCKYFGVSLHEYGTRFVFVIPDGDNYEDYDLQGQDQPSQWGDVSLNSLTICKASNKTSYALAYKRIKAYFGTSQDKNGEILSFDRFLNTFQAYSSLDLATIFYGNSEVVCYHDGVEGVVNVDLSRTQLNVSGGQISRRCDDDWNEPSSWMGSSWSDTFVVCSLKGNSQQSAIKFNVPTQICIAADETAIINIRANVKQGDMSPGADGIKKLYCKLRVGNYWLHAEHPTGSPITMLSWSSTEQVAWLPVDNGALTTDYVLQFPSRLAVYIPDTGGVLLSPPSGIEGTNASVYFELVANAESNDDFDTYNNIIYNISGLSISIVHCDNDNTSVAPSMDRNAIIRNLSNVHGNDYEMECDITTKRGCQYGAGVTVDDDREYITTQYDRLGVERRAILFDKPREVIRVGVRGRVMPIDTVTYGTDRYAVLSQKTNWFDDINELEILKIN